MTEVFSKAIRMPDGLDLHPILTAINPQEDTDQIGIPDAERAVLMERLRKRIESGQLALQQRAQELQRWFHEVARSSANREELESLAALAAERGRAASEVFTPQIESLQQRLNASAELRLSDFGPMLEARIKTAIAWIRLYTDLQAKLLDLATKASPAKVLRAKPIEGEVDHEALSREFMARFPKLRAALAK